MDKKYKNPSIPELQDQTKSIKTAKSIDVKVNNFYDNLQTMKCVLGSEVGDEETPKRIRTSEQRS